MKWCIPGGLLVLSAYFHHQHLYVAFYLCVSLLLLQASSLIIQIVFSAVERAERPRKKIKSSWSWKRCFVVLRREITQAFTPTGGTVIGWLERSAIFLAVAFLAQPWVIVGAIITFKSFGRYPEILAEQTPSRHGNSTRKSVKFVEKFLIGTAISLLIAVVVGMYFRLCILPYYGVNLLEFGTNTAP